MILVCIVVAVLSYLIGSINSAIIISRMRGSDIRSHGSGNAGLTNMLRTFGTTAALSTLLGDVLKGVISIAVTPYIASVICLITKTAVSMPDDFIMFIKCISALACVLGHNFPLYFKFKGGKGVLTGATVIGLVDWKILVSALIVFIVICIITRFVSLSSICACLVIMIMSIVFYSSEITNLGGASVIALCFIVGAMVIIRHKSNILRLIEGTERKLGSK